jgi:hypothetical protein
LLALLAHPKVHISRIKFKMDLQEVGVGSGEWVELGQDMDRWWALVW